MQRVIISLIFCLSSLPLLAQVQTGASIKPLQLLVAAVTEGVGEAPALFMANGTDPHRYALRPSDRRAMERSEVTLWVGPDLEAPLAKVMEELPGEVLTAQTLPGMVLLPAGGGIDPHLWLSTDNAIIMADSLARALGRVDPDNAGHYAANSEQLARTLRTLRDNARQRLAALDNVPVFAVYHNAFAYIEHELGVAHQVSFIGNADVAPGIRRLLQVREQVAGYNIRCVLVEPGVAVQQLQSVIRNEDINYIELDPLAWDFPVSGTAFQAFMEALNNKFVDCLSL